jgi:hypothetical protein
MLCHEDAWHSLAALQQLLPISAAGLGSQHAVVNKQHIKATATAQTGKCVGS